MNFPTKVGLAHGRFLGDIEGVKTPARILLVDDHPIVIFGIRMLLEPHSEFVFEAEAADAAEAVELAEKKRPDIIILDLILGGRDRLELIHDLRQRAPESRIVVYSQLDEARYAERAFRAGAAGYVMKTEGLPTLLLALREVSEEKVHASPSVQRRLLHQIAGKRTAPPGTSLGHLSNRELHIFELLGQGFTTRQIADELGLSPKTIGTYCERLKNKLNLQSSRELIRHAEDYRGTEKSAGPFS